jgi:hypothetical protein
MLVTAHSTSPGTETDKTRRGYTVTLFRYGSFLPTHCRQPARRGFSCGVRGQRTHEVESSDGG